MVRRVALIVVALCLVAQVAVAQRDEHPNYWADAGYGTLAMVTSIVYMPVKLVYACIGGLTGGLAYAVTAGDIEAANRVWSPSVGGTWMISPAMLRGEEPVLFSGASYSHD
jgi:hypothetical protein